MCAERTEELSKSLYLTQQIEFFLEVVKKSKELKESDLLKNDNFAKAEVTFIGDDCKRFVQLLKKLKDEI